MVSGKRKKLNGQRTFLFIDEVPMFNKSQQDSFLPVIEDGSTVFMAATSFLRNPVRIRPTTSHNILITKSLPWNQKCQCSSTSSSSVSVDEDKSVFSVTPATKYDVDYLGEKTKRDWNVKLESLEAFGIDGQATLEGPIEEVVRMEAEEAEGLLKDLGIPSLFHQGNSLVNLLSIFGKVHQILWLALCLVCTGLIPRMVIWIITYMVDGGRFGGLVHTVWYSLRLYIQYGTSE